MVELTSTPPIADATKSPPAPSSPSSPPSPPSPAVTTPTSSSFVEKIQQHPYVALGAGVALVVHLSALLSLPPAIRGRGAPFLPTSQKHGDAMFEQLHEQINRVIASNGTANKNAANSANTSRLARRAQEKSLRFVDLGSGDGRLVFRAAREGIFGQSIGYEINPVLHSFAHLRRLVQAPQYWNNTQFCLRDIWKVDLQNVDVVAVYGLTPIMKSLGAKLQQELQPGSIVLSNVFSIPGWRVESTSRHGTHVYVVPPKEPQTTIQNKSTTK